MKSGSNPKSTPLRSGIKGKNIRRRRKWKPYDGRDKPLINDILNQLANKNIRVETRDGESMTLPKYQSPGPGDYQFHRYLWYKQSFCNFWV